MKRTLQRLLRRLKRSWRRDVPLTRTAREVRARRLTYLSPRKLANLEQCIRRVLEDDVAGDFLEAGVARGGSAILLASRLDGPRRFFGYDVFDTIPPPGPMDGAKSHERYAVIASGKSKGIGGDPYYGYEDDLYDQVVESFEDFGLPVDQERIALHQGLFEDTLRLRAPIAIAHVDCDWYEPVRLCLRRIAPWLSPGGFIVFDDYHDYKGCARAVDEHMAGAADLSIQHAGPNLVLRKAFAAG